MAALLGSSFSKILKMKDPCINYANENFEHCSYTTGDTSRLTDFDKISSAFLAGQLYSNSFTCLELVLKEKWYRMIESGEKKEEYRDIKNYWWKRIFTSDYPEYLPRQGGYNGKHKYVRFRLGYAKDAEYMIWKVGHYRIDEANPKWAEGSMDTMIVISLNTRVV